MAKKTGPTAREIEKLARQYSKLMGLSLKETRDIIKSHVAVGFSKIKDQQGLLNKLKEAKAEAEKLATDIKEQKAKNKADAEARAQDKAAKAETRRGQERIRRGMASRADVARKGVQGPGAQVQRGFKPFFRDLFKESTSKTPIGAGKVGEKLAKDLDWYARQVLKPEAAEKFLKNRGQLRQMVQAIQTVGMQLGPKATQAEFQATMEAVSMAGMRAAGIQTEDFSPDGINRQKHLETKLTTDQKAAKGPRKVSKKVAANVKAKGLPAPTRQVAQTLRGPTIAQAVAGTGIGQKPGILSARGLAGLAQRPLVGGLLGAGAGMLAEQGIRAVMELPKRRRASQALVHQIQAGLLTPREIEQQIQMENLLAQAASESAGGAEALLSQMPMPEGPGAPPQVPGSMSYGGVARGTGEMVPGAGLEEVFGG